MPTFAPILQGNKYAYNLFFKKTSFIKFVDKLGEALVEPCIDQAPIALFYKNDVVVSLSMTSNRVTMLSTQSNL
jgi:hypothetical protein